ncbi:esterase/lipase family protein [Embleya sp. NPDC059237]|uniref:esterase/lipase family protein n=1 Tax=Embleya sp. NPDC059237 TaxID=3346784 RepID=UPI003696CEF3
MTEPTADPIPRFLTADSNERLALAHDPRASAALTELLGADALAELRGLSPTGTPHLGDAGPVDLIFVPGVMGSVLASQGLGGVWWLDIRSRAHIDDLALSPDGHHDAHPAFRIAPVAVDASYESFLLAGARRADLRHSAFAYDWRKPPHLGADLLAERILALRPKPDTRRPVHVVAHSMGGLIVRTALMRHPELWRHIGRIVFLGTPHHGAPAIGGYLKNHLWGFDTLALLGRYLSRDTLRSMWGVLGLLPAPADVYPGGEHPHPCLNFDAYRATDWRLDLSAAGELRLQTVLDAAAAHHRALHTWHAELGQSRRDRMAVIAGVGYRTLFRLAYVPRFGHRWEHMDRVTRRIPGNPHREGDGRVPVASARLASIGEIRYVRGEHGALPAIPAVQDDTWRFLTGRPMRLPRTPAAALSPHLAGDEAVSTPALTGSRVDRDRDPEDPGYLDFDAPSPDVLDGLDERLEAGRLPDFVRTRLL